MKQTIQQLSSKTLPPKAVKELRTVGFLDYEIEQFAKGSRKLIDLTMPIWQRAMKSRKEWIEWMVTRGKTKTKIREIIMKFYSEDKGRTPWDFLFHVYNKPKKVSIVADIISERITKRKLWQQQE